MQISRRLFVTEYILETFANSLEENYGVTKSKERCVSESGLLCLAANLMNGPR